MFLYDSINNSNLFYIFISKSKSILYIYFENEANYSQNNQLKFSKMLETLDFKNIYEKFINSKIKFHSQFVNNNNFVC